MAFYAQFFICAHDWNARHEYCNRGAQTFFNKWKLIQTVSQDAYTSNIRPDKNAHHFQHAENQQITQSLQKHHHSISVDTFVNKRNCHYQI